MSIARKQAIKAKQQAQRTRNVKVAATESFGSVAAEGRVDRENKLIKGVKILGYKSRNPARLLGLDSDETYEYLPDAVKKALPIYENASCYVSHVPTKVDGNGKRVALRTSRGVPELLGRTINCHIREDGLYGDINYLESNPISATLCEVAESMPNKLAMSHQAVCDFNLINGRYACTEILAVDSVDLICDPPGTTAGLFETYATGAKEMDEMPEVPAASDPASTIRDAFKTAIMQVLDDASLDVVAIQKKVKDIIASMDKAIAAISGEKLAPEAPAAESEDAPAEPVDAKAGDKPADEKKPDEKPMESAEVAALRKQLADMQAHESARALLESNGIAADKIKVQAIAALESADLREALVGTWKNATAATVVNPRSANAIEIRGAGVIPETESFPTGEKFVKSLKGR